MSGRILVIRGGAVGDFILTMPAIRLLRENFPEAHIEILGYPAITKLACDAFHADATRSIEYGPMAGFFSRKSVLQPQLAEYFAGFHQVISYLYDPDWIFETNLRLAGVKNLLIGPGRLTEQIHAAHQLARPLEQLALFLGDPFARFFPTAEDEAETAFFLKRMDRPFVAIHPGSGSIRKNWPLKRWSELIPRIQRAGFQVLITAGEADESVAGPLEKCFRIPVARNLPLRTLGAILSQAVLYIGNDSGISHLAAASGCRCILLFGPTDPGIWAPRNPDVAVIRSPSLEMAAIDVADVLKSAGFL